MCYFETKVLEMVWFSLRSEKHWLQDMGGQTETETEALVCVDINLVILL